MLTHPDTMLRNSPRCDGVVYISHVRSPEDLVQASRIASTTLIAPYFMMWSRGDTPSGIL